ncbi:response regulator [Belnapia sp. T6]|uniref:Response regulator n=1 Tax=Belnapia mucosa TaxID=2804532 RepID=A0ABS1VB37_9PROT|nr:response regulator [Belnapia mucosa]MBL6458855.1 response regulator [Belnapia mucosa]
MRILVVEDEALIAMMLADDLETAGHEVMGPVATTAAALTLCETTLPDLALLDVNLAGGDNGVALACDLFARWHLPVVFASSQPVEVLQEAPAALGIIHKPYQTETVLRSVEAVRAVLDGRKPSDMPAGFKLFLPGAQPELLTKPFGMADSTNARSHERAYIKFVHDCRSL